MVTPTDPDSILLGTGTGRHIDRFMCLDCLAAFFHTDRESLEAKIEAFRDDGCPLFE